MLSLKRIIASAIFVSLVFSSTVFAADQSSGSEIIASSPVVTDSSAAQEISSDKSFVENNADMQIYSTDFDGLYNINIYEYGENLPVTFYEKAVDGNIYALMYNGTFVPCPELLTSKGTVYVSASKLSEFVKNEADPSTFEKNYYTFKVGENSIQINTNSTNAVINGEKTDIGYFTAPLYNYNNGNDELYVPLRPIIEALGGNVEYIQNFQETFADGITRNYSAVVNIIIIEMPTENEKVYTVEEGLDILIPLSNETYEYVKSYLKETGRTFSDADPDYNPEDIKYIGDMGRYYMYQLNGFEEFPLMVNKYTGEVFSCKPGLPFVSISKGFPNIGWLYQ